jgi:2-hydroxychromene-2-carboxylate isomerase
MRASTEPAIKDKLKANTEEALGKGAFGAPVMIAKRPDGVEKKFFGQDRIQPMLYFLGMIPRARY